MSETVKKSQLCEKVATVRNKCAMWKNKQIHNCEKIAIMRKKLQLWETIMQYKVAKLQVCKTIVIVKTSHNYEKQCSMKLQLWETNVQLGKKSQL